MALELQGPLPQLGFRWFPIYNSVNDWLDEFRLFECGIQSKLEYMSVTKLTSTRALSSCGLCILSRCAPFKRRLLFDTYSGNFEQLMVRLLAFYYSHSTRVLIPVLFFVATRYRNASFRRRAIEFLPAVWSRRPNSLKDCSQSESTWREECLKIQSLTDISRSKSGQAG